MFQEKILLKSEILPWPSYFPSKRANHYIIQIRHDSFLKSISWSVLWQTYNSLTCLAPLLLSENTQHSSLVNVILTANLQFAYGS